MISYQVETYDVCHREIAPHLPQHFEEIALDKGAVPLDIDWPIYKDLADKGMLHIVTAREASEVVGYIVGFVRPHVHYKSTLHCFTDIFWLHPDRRKGMAGVKLFKEYERSLKRRGVVKVFIASKCHLDMSPIFERLGWHRTEVVYTKVI